MHRTEDLCLLYCVWKASMAVTTRGPVYRCGDAVGTRITIRMKDVGYVHFLK